MPLPEEHAALIPEDIRSDPALQSFNDVGGIAKSFIETKSLVGRSIQLPNGEAKPEDIDKWAGETSAKLRDRGLAISKLTDLPPASPEGYEFKFDGVADEALKSDKVLGAFKPIAHKLGLNNSQASALVEHFAKDILPAMQAGAPKPPEFIEGDAVNNLMQKTFGAEAKQALDEFKSGVKQLSTEIPQLYDVLNEGVVEVDGGKFISLGDHPAIVTLVREVAKLKAQDFSGNLDGIIGGETLESIDDKINAVRNDKALTSQKQGERLEPLYKIKDALVKRAEASARR